jgi:hypothetical protein
MDRDETTLRECNWAIVSLYSLPRLRGGTSLTALLDCTDLQAQYKALPPTAGRSAFAHEDPRSDDMYVVYEEIVSRFIRLVAMRCESDHPRLL